MKSYFFRNPSMSRAAIAALGLALIVGLGTPPAAAQFVCGQAGTYPVVAATVTVPGAGALAGGLGSTNVACGTSANASGDVSSNTATGTGANASGAGSSNVAIGNGAQAIGIGTSNTAIGSGALANFANSAAFGAGAIATRPGQQVFGTSSNTYTMSGINSAASTAAQSGATSIVTSDSAGNLAAVTPASLGFASSGQINAINGRLNDLDNRSNRAYTGIAMAFAMAGVPTLMPNEKVAVTMNWGTFQSSNGLALNAALRIADNVQFNAGTGYGPDEKIAGGRAGLRFGW